MNIKVKYKTNNSIDKIKQFIEKNKMSKSGYIDCEHLNCKSSDCLLYWYVIKYPKKYKKLSCEQIYKIFEKKIEKNDKLDEILK